MTDKRPQDIQNENVDSAKSRAPVERAYEPPVLVCHGKLGEVIKGSSGSVTDFPQSGTRPG